MEMTTISKNIQVKQTENGGLAISIRGGYIPPEDRETAKELAFYLLGWVEGSGRCAKCGTELMEGEEGVCSIFSCNQETPRTHSVSTTISLHYGRK